jgi:hypothetical protein
MRFSFTSMDRAFRVRDAFADLKLPAKVEYSGGDWSVKTTSACLAYAPALVKLVCGGAR